MAKRKESSKKFATFTFRIVAAQVAGGAMNGCDPLEQPGR
jgi:hypothetical protein